MGTFLAIRLRALAGITMAALLAAIVWGATPALADSAPIDPANPASPATVAGDALPTVQINGVVWAQLIVGNTVYVGGQFTRARPAGSAPGVNEVVRNNMLAYDLTTGVLTSFDPNVNAPVRTLVAAPDGSRVYAGGSFTTVGGVSRYRIAAFTPSTGALVTPWNPGTNSQVSALAVTATTLYAAGSFSSSSNQARNGISAYSTATGALLPWAGEPTGGRVTSLVVSPDASKVVLGGSFTAYNGGTSPGYGLAAVDATTGASLPWKVNSVIRNAGATASITSLSSSAEGVFGTGYVFTGGGGNFEGTFRASWEDGTLLWLEDCHGDTYSAAPAGAVVYTTGHAHFCGNIGGFPETPQRSWQRTLTFSMAATGVAAKNTSGGYGDFVGQPTPTLLPFYSDINTGTYTGQGQGPWNVVANAQYALYGGEFTIVNNKAQQGLVRFAVPAIAPNKEGPRVTDTYFAPSAFVPTVAWTASSRARLSWPAAYDRDNENLTYEVLRNGVPVGSQTAASVFWKRPTLTFTDSGLRQGATYLYRIRVTDPFGNTITGDPVSVTPAALSNYAAAVLEDSPLSYWPVGEAGGTTAYDWAAAADLTTKAGVTRNVEGGIGAGAASRFNGTTTGFAATTTPIAASNSFSLEAWVKTTTTTGGKIIGFGNKTTSASSMYDRHVYMDNTGRIFFGVKPSTIRTVNSTASYNDGAWHHVVATLGANGMELFVDGASVAARTDTTSGEGAYQGFWRVGGDSMGSWPGTPTSPYIAADIDDVAVYGAPLSAEQVSYHSFIGKGGTPRNVPPTAEFAAATDHLSVTTDAGISADPDGAITGYDWIWGDGTTGTGKTATHTYAQAGTYTVGLTVTDNVGATTSTTRSIVATEPPVNSAPTASFTAAVTPLTVAVDAAGSSDADGTITAASWAWGDGSTGAGMTASHGYAVPGSYEVTLTVTDDAGAVGTNVQTVVVPAPDPAAAFAADTFERTVAGGLGTSDIGGPWTVSGSTSNYAVSGGAGTLRAAGPGATVNAYLSKVSSTNTEVNVQASLSRPTTGAGNFVSVLARRVGTDDYRARVKVLATGVVQIQLLRGGTTLSAATVSGLTYAATETLQVKVQAVGTSPTTLRAKVWKVGTSEPAGWQLSTTDSTAAMQAAGSIGLSLYLSSTSENVPLTAAFDNLVARPAP